MAIIPISKIFGTVPDIKEAGDGIRSGRLGISELTTPDVNFSYRFAFCDILKLLIEGKCTLFLTEKDLRVCIKKAESSLKDLKTDFKRPADERHAAGTDEEVKADIEAQTKVLKMWRSLLSEYYK